MKRSQAIHHRLTEEHEVLSGKASILSAGLLARTQPDQLDYEQSHVISQPLAEPAPYLSVVDTPAPEWTEDKPVHAKAPPARTFPYYEFVSNLDPAVVKARYLVGPIDPLILFVGDLDERHGPDLLIRAMPPVLKKHPQARLVIVGDGDLLWPLKVMSRYMLLDYAVRIVGHVGGKDVRELVAASDVMAVPSRSQTEDWQILSGWSAARPVVATQAVSNELCRHEENSLVVAAEPNSLVEALDRVLSDRELGRKIADRGYRKIINEFAGETALGPGLQA